MRDTWIHWLREVTSCDEPIAQARCAGPINSSYVEASRPQLPHVLAIAGAHVENADSTPMLMLSMPKELCEARHQASVEVVLKALGYSPPAGTLVGMLAMPRCDAQEDEHGSP